MLTAALQDLSRLRGISVVVAKHGFHQVADRLRTGVGGDRLAKIDEAPRRFRMLLQDLGPSFIKLGQVLSTRPDLLPSAYIEELKNLQDNTAPLAFDVITKSIEEALKEPCDKLFASIEEKPLGTASIAQVHRATLSDGRAVVIKVQRPDIEKTIRSDIDLLYLLARVLEGTIEESTIYAPTRIVKEFEHAILEELDFLHEVSNIQAFERNFPADGPLRFPKVVEERTTRTVLCLEYIEGVKLSQIERGDERVEAILTTLLDGYFHMVYRDGLFHGDPHPGNILVLPEGRLALLDMGLVGRLPKGIQDALTQISIAVAMRDAETTARLIYRLGTPEERVDLLEFRNEIDDIFARYLSGRLEDVNARNLLAEMLDLAIRHRIRIPSDCALLGKVSLTLEGVIRTLKPDLEVGASMTPYARRLVGQRFGMGQLGKVALRGAMGLVDALQDMPLHVSQLVGDLEGGRFTVRVSHQELDQLSRRLNDLGTKVFMGMIACGLIVGSCMWLARYPLEVKGMPIVPMIGLVAAGLIMTLVFGWHVLYGRIRKVRLLWWLGLWRWGRRKSP